MAFPRQEYWSKVPFPHPGHLSDPGIEPASLTTSSCTGRWILYHLCHPGSPLVKAAFPILRHSRLAPYGHDLCFWIGPHALFCKILSPTETIFPKKESAKQKRNFCPTPEQWVQTAGSFCNSFASFFLACNGPIEEGAAACSFSYFRGKRVEWTVVG